MPSRGTSSSGISAGRIIVSLATALSIALPAAEVFAQAREPIPPALFGGDSSTGQGAARPAKPQRPAERPAANAAQAQSRTSAKPAGTPTQTPFGIIYRPLDSSKFVPFTASETAPLQPKGAPHPQEPAPADVKPEAPAAVPAETAPAPQPQPVPAEAEPEAPTPAPAGTAPAPQPQPQPAERETASPPVERPAAPIPADVPLPPRAPANRGTASGQPAPETPAAPVQAPQAPAPVPPPATLPATSNLSDRQIVERANRFFNTMETLQANFTQLGGSQRTTGTLYLERPGRVRFAYNPPSTLEIVSDGKNVAIRDSKLKTSDVYAINQTPLKFLLRDPINLGSDLKVLDVVRDPTSIQITLEDASTIGGKAQITLFFDQQVQSLTRWTIVDAQGYTTTVILSQVKRSQRRG